VNSCHPKWNPRTLEINANPWMCPGHPGTIIFGLPFGNQFASQVGQRNICKMISCNTLGELYLEFLVELSKINAKVPVRIPIHRLEPNPKGNLPLVFLPKFPKKGINHGLLLFRLPLIGNPATR